MTFGAFDIRNGDGNYKILTVSGPKLRAISLGYYIAGWTIPEHILGVI